MTEHNEEKCTESTPVFSLVDVHKSVDTATGPLAIIKGITFSMQKGDSLALVGASGSGKTTLLNLLSAFDTISSGIIYFNGSDISSLNTKEKAVFRNRNLGFIFQFHQLLPEFNTIENVAMPAIIAGNTRKDALKVAQEALEKVEIAHLAKNSVLTLSGGERQRVAIARAISLSPSVLLADEPTGNLDVHTGQTITNLMVELNKNYGMSLIVVTHNLELAAQMNKKMELRDGVLI